MNNINLKKLSEYDEILSLSATDIIHVSEKISTGVYQTRKCQLQTLTDYMANESFSVIADYPLSGDGSAEDHLKLLYNTEMFSYGNDNELIINYEEDGNGISLKPSRNDHGHTNLALSGMNDVTISSGNISDNQSIYWNATNSKWENKNFGYVSNVDYEVMINGSNNESTSAIVTSGSPTLTNIFYDDKHPLSGQTVLAAAWSEVFPLYLHKNTTKSVISIQGNTSSAPWTIDFIVHWDTNFVTGSQMYLNSGTHKNACLSGNVGDVITWTYLGDSTLSAQYSNIKTGFEIVNDDNLPTIYTLPTVNKTDRFRILMKNTVTTVEDVV